MPISHPCSSSLPLALPLFQLLWGGPEGMLMAYRPHTPWPHMPSARMWLCTTEAHRNFTPPLLWVVLCGHSAEKTSLSILLSISFSFSLCLNLSAVALVLFIPFILSLVCFSGFVSHSAGIRLWAKCCCLACCKCEWGFVSTPLPFFHPGLVSRPSVDHTHSGTYPPTLQPRQTHYPASNTHTLTDAMVHTWSDDVHLFQTVQLKTLNQIVIHNLHSSVI